MSTGHHEGAAPGATLWLTYGERRYTILFCTLAAALVAVPVSASLGFGTNAVDIFLGFALLAAVLPMSRRPGIRAALVGLFVVAILMRVGSILLDNGILAAVTMFLWTLIALAAGTSALMFAVRGQEVAREHVFAALSAYLIAGLYFGLLHWVIEELHPGSYSVPGHFTHTASYYFSFVTLATIGFGDIVPKSDIARGLTVIEGIGGQLFLAVLVARLVSQHGKAR